MDITPLNPKGRQVIQTYGDGGFTIAGKKHKGSVVVLPEQTIPWNIDSFTAVTADTLAPAVEFVPRFGFLLLGSGVKQATLDPLLVDSLRIKGITLEVMQTGAACRTFNVLLAEDRPAAAALIAVN